MAYYIGTQEFATIGEATDFMRRNPDVAEEGLRITSEPVENEGMLTGGVKGEPTKQAPIVPDEPPTATTPQTFTFVEGREKGDGDFQNYLYGQTGEVQQVTVDELRDYFESDDVNRLREMFGTFDNYLAYMTEREQLIQSGDYDTGNWSEADAGFTEDQEMILEGDADLTIDPSDPGQNLENLRRQQTSTQQGAYNNWLNSEANQALLQKYGVQSTVYSGSGDKFQWNGSAYVKVEEVSNPGVTDFAKSGILAAMTYYMGAGLTDFLSSSTLTTASGQTIAGPGLSSSLATGASSGISNAAMQLVATGNVDFGEALESAITAGLGAEALRQIQQSGVLDQLVETVGQYTERQDWISLEDGTLFKLVNEYDANGNLIDSLSRVLMPNGGTLSLENFLQFASEGTFGSPVLFDAVGLPVFFFREGLQTPEFIDRLIEAASDAYSENGSTFNQIVNFLSGGSSSGGGSSSYEAVLTGDLNSTSNNATLLNMLRGALENTTDPETRADLERQIEAYEREVEEDEEEVDVNEDDTVEDADSVLADTTADNAPGITEEMFQDVVEQVRADNQVETQEIIDAINALGVADLPTLAQIEAAFPELDVPSLTEIGNTVSTLLSEAGLLTSEQFTEAMAGVLTPEQLATALANLPYGDAQDFIDAISNAGYATPEDVATALNNADLMSNEDFNTYMEQFREDVVGDVGTLLDTAFAEFAFPETFTDEQIQQLRDSIVIPESATMEQIQAALDALAEQIPTAAPTLEEMQTLFNTELANLDIASPQDVRDALAEFNFSEAQIAQIIDALPEGLSVADLGTALEGVVVGEDLDAAVTTITDAIGGLDIASPEDIKTILSEYGFTAAQLEQIAGSITIPASATVAEVQAIVDSIPAGLTAEEVATQLSSQFEGLTTGIAGVQSGIDQLAEDLGLSTEGLIAAITGLGEATGEDLTDLQTNILEGLGLLSQDLGVDIGDVVTSVTDLGEGVAEGIEGLGEQLTGLGEGITDVQGGIEELAEQLGLSTEDLITAIGNLSTATGESLTGLETSILTGLGSLADTLGLDVGEVVTSVTDLSADVVEGIAGLEDQLTTGFEGVQGGINALAEQLGVSSDDIVTAIGNLGTLTSEELTGFETSVLTGLTDLASTLGLDIGDVVTSVTDLEAGLTENITGLSDQLTGVEEAVGGVTTAVNQGIEDLADALGVQTDDITSAIVTLGSGLGGELTELETSVLSGLSSLADSLGTDVGTVVDSIGGLGTGISENIQGLSETLTEQLGTGFGGISGQLESGFGQLGQQLGLATLGLLGLGAKQPTAQEIAAAQREFKYTPFDEKASPRQVQQVVKTAPIKQQPSALQQLNQFLDRQSTTPQKPPRKPGMLA